MHDLQQLMEIIDQRLSNLELIVDALEERVMRESICIEFLCPRCNTKIRIIESGYVQLNSSDR